MFTRFLFTQFQGRTEVLVLWSTVLLSRVEVLRFGSPLSPLDYVCGFLDNPASGDFHLCTSDSVPRAPEIDVCSCSVQDNAIHVAWRPLVEADSGADGCRPICYEVEYRKTNHGSSLGGACWERLCDITEAQVTISGERSHSGAAPEQSLIWSSGPKQLIRVFDDKSLRSKVRLTVCRRSSSSQKQSSSWRILRAGCHGNQR